MSDSSTKNPPAIAHLPGSKLAPSSPPRVLRWLILLPALVVPLFLLVLFRYTPTPRFAGILLNESQKYVSEILTLGFCVGAGLLCMAVRAQFPHLPKRLWVPILMMIVGLSIGMVRSHNLWLGMQFGFTVYLLPLLFFLVLVSWQWGLDQVKRICWFALGAATVVALVGIAQVYDLGSIGVLFPSEVPRSLLGNKNFAAEYLITLIPTAAALVLMSGRGWVRGLAAVITLLMLLHLVLTTARGAWVGFVVGDILAMLLATIALLRQEGRLGAVSALGQLSVAKRLSLLLLVPLFFVLIISSSWWLPQTASVSRNPTEQFARIDAEQSGTRWEIWADTMSMIADEGLFGAGPHHYQVLAPRYWGERAASYLKWEEDSGTLTSPRYPHNDYLQIWLEGGITALIGLVALFAAVSWYAATGIARSLASGDLRRALLLKGLFAGFIAFTVAMLFEFPLRIPASLVNGWLCAGLVVSLSRNGDCSWVSMKGCFSRIAVVGVTVALCIVSLFFAHRLLWSNYYLANGDWHWVKQRGYRAVESVEKAYRLTPWDHNTGLRLARAQYFMGRYSAALTTCDELIMLYPDSLPVLWVKRRVAEALGRGELFQQIDRRMKKQFSKVVLGNGK